MRVFLRKPTRPRVVVPCPQVIRPALAVLRDDIPAVYQVHRGHAVHGLDPADAVRVVLISHHGSSRSASKEGKLSIGRR